jgi:hypothetical protein
VAPEHPIPTPRPAGAESAAHPWQVEQDDHGVTARVDHDPVAHAGVLDDPSRVSLVFWVDERLPQALRTELARTAFEHPALRPDRPVAVALPQRETELLREVRSHLADDSTHVAGATCLIEGRVR